MECFDFWLLKQQFLLAGGLTMCQSCAPMRTNEENLCQVRTCLDASVVHVR